MDERFVPKKLRGLADLYAERNDEYGDSYRIFGKLMDAMFPNGITIKGVRFWNRLGIFMQIVWKIVRFRAAFEAGRPQDDSLADTAVYAAMLWELESEFWDTKKDEDTNPKPDPDAYPGTHTAGCGYRD